VRRIAPGVAISWARAPGISQTRPTRLPWAPSGGGKRLLQTSSAIGKVGRQAISAANAKPSNPGPHPRGSLPPRIRPAPLLPSPASAAIAPGLPPKQPLGKTAIHRQKHGSPEPCVPVIPLSPKQRLPGRSSANQPTWSDSPVAIDAHMHNEAHPALCTDSQAPATICPCCRMAPTTLALDPVG
jgi:hypothetical protein